MKTIQEMLVDRTGKDPRTHMAVAESTAGRVRITFPGIGDQPQIVLTVEGNVVTVVEPAVFTPTAEANALADEEAATLRRRMTPDNVQPGDNLPANSFALAASLQDTGGEIKSDDDGKFFNSEGEQVVVLTQEQLSTYAKLNLDPFSGQPIVREHEAGGDHGDDAEVQRQDGVEIDDKGSVVVGSVVAAGPKPEDDSENADTGTGTDGAGTGSSEGTSAPATQTTATASTGGDGTTTGVGEKLDDTTPAKLEPVDLKSSKDELIAIAKERGVAVDENATKAVIADAINAAIK